MLCEAQAEGSLLRWQSSLLFAGCPRYFERIIIHLNYVAFDLLSHHRLGSSSLPSVQACEVRLCNQIHLCLRPEHLGLPLKALQNHLSLRSAQCISEKRQLSPHFAEGMDGLCSPTLFCFVLDWASDCLLVLLQAPLFILMSYLNRISRHSLSPLNSFWAMESSVWPLYSTQVVSYFGLLE